MSEYSLDICPICRANAKADDSRSTSNSSRVYLCVKCGLFRIAGSFTVQPDKYDDPIFLTYLRQLLWMDCVKRFQAEESKPRQFSGYPAILTEAMLKEARKKHRFLNIADQIDNAIFAFAADEDGYLKGYQESNPQNKPTPETAINNKDLLILRLIGIDITSITLGPNISQAHGFDASVLPLIWAFFACKHPPYLDMRNEMIVTGLLKESSQKTSQPKPITKLTSKGWQRFNEMQSGARITANAFMAMGFTGSNQMAYKHIFKPAVEACGFQLHTNYELPNHGSIPDDIELKIKRAPFVIVDISGGNNGAYWEAGYATALGKPVIYTCDEKTFRSKSRKNKPHFDVAHRQRVMWVDAPEDEIQEKNKDALKTIKAIIRNNIPGAKLDD